MTAALSDLMAAALRDIPNIHDKGTRAMAYIHAGIDLHDMPREDMRAADEAALSIELSKRMEGRNDPGA